jgi:hypothetical protein
MTRAVTPDRDVRWAWGFVVLIVAAGIAAQVLGYGIAVLLGYDVPEAATPYLGAALLTGIQHLNGTTVSGIALRIQGVTLPDLWFPRDRGGFPMPLPARSWIP